MLKISKLYFLFKNSKINFSNPSHNKILLFDNERIEDFQNVLSRRKFFVLTTRVERIREIFLSSKIFLYFLKYLNKNLFTSYLIALIKTINPKVVITTIDNSFKFHEIAKILKNDKIEFICVQNAARYDYAIHDYVYKNKFCSQNLNKKFYIPIFYCYGDEEEKLCKKYNIEVKKFYKKGSLRLSNYLNYKKNKNVSIKKNFYDISLISEPSEYKDIELFTKGIDDRFAIIAKFTIKYVLKNNLKFLFITKREPGAGQEREIEFYCKYLNQVEKNFLKKNLLIVDRDNYKSYFAIEESNLVVGQISTMLRDKLALQGKILACNFSGIDVYDFPIKSLCFLKNPSYDQFDERIDYILKMPINEFFLNLEIRKLINTDENNLTFNYLNKHIDEIIY